MKTVRAPKAPSVHTIECRNRKCEAVIEASEDELRKVYDQRDGNALVMKCPHCQQETWVSV